MRNFEDFLSQGYLPKLPRVGCKDIWNAFMVDGATFSSHDIPLCPTNLPNGLPRDLISFPDAKTIYNTAVRAGNSVFHVDAFVHFYCDDYLFDGPKNSIWLHPEKALSILKHFDGIITPDFSTYSDFPDPIKRYNTYRMRAFGLWCVSNGIPVINNVRWGTSETWEYCFDGIEHNSVLCVGTIASGLKEIENRQYFNAGYIEMLRKKEPKTILVYGSSKYDIFKKTQELGIEIFSYMSQTNAAHIKKRGDRQ